MQVNATNIFKETLTPRPMRKDMTGGSTTLQKSHSCSSIKDQDRSPLENRKFKFDNNLTVHVSPHSSMLNENEAHKLLILQSSASIPTIMTEDADFKPYTNGNNNYNNNSQLSVKIDVPESPLEKDPPKITWTTMTPQQISIWIDK